MEISGKWNEGQLEDEVMLSALRERWQKKTGSNLYVFSRAAVLECNWKCCSETRERMRKVKSGASGKKAIIAKAMDANRIKFNLERNSNRHKEDRNMRAACIKRRVSNSKLDPFLNPLYFKYHWNFYQQKNAFSIKKKLSFNFCIVALIGFVIQHPSVERQLVCESLSSYSHILKNHHLICSGEFFYSNL